MAKFARAVKELFVLSTQSKAACTHSSETFGSKAKSLINILFLLYPLYPVDVQKSLETVEINEKGGGTTKHHSADNLRTFKANLLALPVFHIIPRC